MTTHCVSLELEKKLREAGWNKRTKFWYNFNPVTKELILDDIDRTGWSCNRGDTKYYEVLPAPLATEILEELPEEVCWGGKSFDNKIKVKAKYFVNYDGEYFKQVWADSFPDALAKMWLYLREKKEV